MDSSSHLLKIPQYFFSSQHTCTFREPFHKMSFNFSVFFLILNCHNSLQPSAMSIGKVTQTLICHLYQCHHQLSTCLCLCGLPARASKAMNTQFILSRQRKMFHNKHEGNMNVKFMPRSLRALDLPGHSLTVLSPCHACESGIRKFWQLKGCLS